MIDWTKKGEAVVGALSLADGCTGNAVVVGGRDNPRGAVIVFAKEGSDKPESVSLAEASVLIGPQDIIDILAIQERLHGTRGLTRPAGL
ncbi:MAG: hypothetical protein IIB38_04960 [Candidatus Hydrogenedentes bacterium]|nr:hypothetical protein [Candidatus Hydrogenedentota bacterium]